LAEDEAADVDDEDIHVYLPRFELNTKLRLVEMLKKVFSYFTSKAPFKCYDF